MLKFLGTLIVPISPDGLAVVSFVGSNYARVIVRCSLTLGNSRI